MREILFDHFYRSLINKTDLKIAAQEAISGFKIHMGKSQRLLVDAYTAWHTGTRFLHGR